MDTVVGGIVTISLGVIAIAAIYQLGKAPSLTSAIAGNSNSAVNAGLASLFKG